MKKNKIIEEIVNYCNENNITVFENVGCCNAPDVQLFMFGKMYYICVADSSKREFKKKQALLETLKQATGGIGLIIEKYETFVDFMELIKVCNKYE